jgi:hypothetical protein
VMTWGRGRIDGLQPRAALEPLGDAFAGRGQDSILGARLPHPRPHNGFDHGHVLAHCGGDPVILGAGSRFTADMSGLPAL